MSSLRYRQRRSFGLPTSNAISSRSRDGQSLNVALDLEPLEQRNLLASDFGDAPAPYATLIAENGAEHDESGPILGATRDTEADGTHSAAADADGADEDGVTFGSIQVGQLDASFTVTVDGDDGRLDAWIDFNQDDTWNGPDELVADNVFVPDGVHVLNFDVPGWALSGTTYARFRLSTLGDLGPGGFAADGEVEDYQVTIDPPAASPGHFARENVIASDADPAFDVYTVDMEGDGDLDALSASFDDNEIVWYENDGSQNYTPHVISSTAYGAHAVFAHDIDGDYDIDVLSASYNNDSITWYENDGAQNFTPHAITTTADGAGDVMAADVNGDGYLDVLSASILDDTIAWYENDGIQNFTQHAITTTADAPHAVAVADVDGDGDLDALSASFDDNTVAWHENDGSQNFTPHTISSTAVGAYSVVAADIDGDGNTDVASAAYEGDEITWYENDGAQNFTTHVLTTWANGAISVIVADLDGDADSDIVAASFIDGRLIWFENDGAENFTERLISNISGGAISVLAADADDDGDLDVFSAAYFEDEIAWHENVAGDVDGRHLFYNQSAFDGNNASINLSDDTAIAPDKTAYLPGDGLAVFGNVSSYSRGINGIMIDLAGGGNHSDIALSTLASDFVFKVGNNNTPSSWASAPTPNAVSVRTNFDLNGTDRVVITWADGAIKNQWLEVQVLPTTRTGLTSTDVFFWGNKIGDIGSPTATTFTTTASGDANPIIAGGLGPAGGITNVRDIDRSNTITAAGDRAAAIGNIGAIVRINIGTAGPFAPADGDAEESGDAGVASALAVTSTASSTAPRALPTNVARRVDVGPAAASPTAAYFAQLGQDDSQGDADDDDPLADLLSSLAAGRPRR